jgi:hypothetical protein
LFPPSSSSSPPLPSPPPPIFPPYCNTFFYATYSVCIYISGSRSNKLTSLVESMLKNIFQNVTTWHTWLLNLDECQINEYRYFRELNLQYHILWTVIRIYYICEFGISWG